MASKKKPSTSPAPAPAPASISSEMGYRVIGVDEQRPPQIYCDGILGMTLNVAVCKLDLFQVVGSDRPGEVRQPTQTLVMPTAALLQLCRSVLDHVEKNTSLLKTAMVDKEALIFGLKDTKQRIAEADNSGEKKPK